MEKDDEEVFVALEKFLRAYTRHLEDINSIMPETQKFLRSRGLTYVRELDRKGREELKAHLENILARLKLVHEPKKQPR